MGLKPPSSRDLHPSGLAVLCSRPGSDRRVFSEPSVGPGEGRVAKCGLRLIRYLSLGFRGPPPGGRLQVANSWGRVQASGEPGLAGTWSLLLKALPGAALGSLETPGGPSCLSWGVEMPNGPHASSCSLHLPRPPSSLQKASLCYVPRLLCHTPESKPDCPGISWFLPRSEPGPLGSAQGGAVPPPKAFHTPVPWAAGD